MPQMVQLKQGWENEHLATYLLSRISFVARPVFVVDDVGIDLYCTLFEVEADTVDCREYAQPRNAIAVQIKSNAKAFDVTNKLDYFVNLELPFYVGVLDRAAQTLALYSAMYLPQLLSLKGKPPKLWMKPVPCLSGDSYYEKEDGGCTLLCPLTTSLNAADDRERQKECFCKLHQNAVDVLKSIGSKLNHEYIFKTPSGELEIFAGPTSARHFETNFFKRLAEAFYNLEWLRTNEPDGVQPKIDAFLAVYDTLRLRMPVPDYVEKMAERLRALSKS